MVGFQFKSEGSNSCQTPNLFKVKKGSFSGHFKAIQHSCSSKLILLLTFIRFFSSWVFGKIFNKPTGVAFKNTLYATCSRNNNHPVLRFQPRFDISTSLNYISSIFIQKYHKKKLKCGFSISFHLTCLTMFLLWLN